MEEPLHEVHPKHLDGVFWQPLILLQKHLQVAARAELEDQPDIVLRLIPAVEAQQVRVSRHLMHDVHLVVDPILLRLVYALDGQILDGILLAPFIYR